MPNFAQNRFTNAMVQFKFIKTIHSILYWERINEFQLLS